MVEKFYYSHLKCECSYSIYQPLTRINTGKTKDRRFKIVGLLMVAEAGFEPTTFGL